MEGGADSQATLRNAIIESATQSFEELGVGKVRGTGRLRKERRLTSYRTQVDTYYLHSPDPAGTSIKETVDTMDEIYKQGRFKHVRLPFGSASVFLLYGSSN